MVYRRDGNFYDQHGDPKEYLAIWLADPKYAEVAAAMKKVLDDGWKAALPSGEMTVRRTVTEKIPSL